MRLTSQLLALVLLAGSGAATEVRAQDAGPTPEALEALRHYLLVDCEVGEETPALTLLLRHAEVIEPELRRLLLEGPDDSLRGEVTAALVDEWERRAAFLETNPDLGLDAHVLAAVLQISETDFIERGQERFDLACREKAVVGLDAIGSPGARRALGEAITGVESEELRGLILSVLQGRRPTERQKPSLQRRKRAPRTGSD
jgi:hypothetical protein